MPARSICFVFTALNSSADTPYSLRAYATFCEWDHDEETGTTEGYVQFPTNRKFPVWRALVSYTSQTLKEYVVRDPPRKYSFGTRKLVAPRSIRPADPKYLQFIENQSTVDQYNVRRSLIASLDRKEQSEVNRHNRRLRDINRLRAALKFQDEEDVALASYDTAKVLSMFPEKIVYFDTPTDSIKPTSPYITLILISL